MDPLIKTRSTVTRECFNDDLTCKKERTLFLITIKILYNILPILNNLKCSNSKCEIHKVLLNWLLFQF